MSYAGTILEVWSESLLLRLDSPRGLHPSARASDLWTCPQTPPFAQFAQKGCQLTGLELRIPTIYLGFRGSGPEIFWRPPQKLRPPLGSTTPPPSSDWTHTYVNQSKALNVRISNALFLLGYRHAVQKLHKLLPPVIPQKYCV